MQLDPRRTFRAQAVHVLRQQRYCGDNYPEGGWPDVNMALCGIHRPEDMLTDDRAAVTCARCRARVNFSQGTGPTITPLPIDPPRPRVIWWECGCEIACLCGAGCLIVSDETPATCDECGRVWSLHTKLDCKEAQP